MTEENAPKDEKLTPEAEEHIITEIYRWRANMLCFWRLCPKAACRRAKACSVDPDVCMKRFAFLIGEDVRKAVDTLLDAKIHGRSFDEAHAMAPPGSLEAYELWLSQIQ